MANPLPTKIRLYNFSEVELLQAQRLPPLTAQYFEHQAAQIVGELVNFEFSSNPLEQQTQIYQYIALQARYRALMDMINEADLAYQQAAEESQSNPV